MNVTLEIDSDAPGTYPHLWGRGHRFWSATYNFILGRFKDGWRLHGIRERALMFEEDFYNRAPQSFIPLAQSVQKLSHHENDKKVVSG